MGIVDQIRLHGGVSSRIAEETLFAEALREVESGLRRDGLWAKALSSCNMRRDDAKALYLTLRVQSLRDEVELAIQDVQLRARFDEDRVKELQAKRRSLEQTERRIERERPPQTTRDWVNVLFGAAAVILLGIFVASLLEKLK